MIVYPGQRGRGRRDHVDRARRTTSSSSRSVAAPTSPAASSRRVTSAARFCRSTCGKMDAVIEIDEVVAPGPHPGRCARAATRGAAQRRRVGPSGTSPTASPTRRSAAGSPPARRACSPTSTATSRDITAGLRVVTPGGRARDSRRCRRRRPGPSVREMILGSEGRLGHHHRGDRAGAPHAGAAQDPRLPLPRLVRRASPPCTRSPRATRHRRSPGSSDAERDRVLASRRKKPGGSSTGTQSAGAQGVPPAGSSTTTWTRRAWRSSGTRAPSST